MNNRPLLLRQLSHKEFRQLMPLAITLLATGALLNLWYWLVPWPQSIAVNSGLLWWTTPMLYALGVGAISVSHEKETRTLTWLVSLPVRHTELIRIKLLVSVIGLAIIWGASLVMSFLVFTRRSDVPAWATPSIGDVGETLAFIVRSFYLLMAGTAIAWRFKPSLALLFLLVPTALAPTLVAGLLDYLFSYPQSVPMVRYFARHQNPELRYIVASHASFGGIALWYTFRAAHRYLGAQPCPTYVSDAGRALGHPTTSDAGRTATKVSEQDTNTTATYRMPLTPIGGLVWQFTRQNIGVLGGVSLGIVGAIVALRLHPEINGLSRLGIGVASLAVSWLGVCCFQADRVQQRIRFLADRGVSPGKTWYSRQVVPVSLLLIGLLGHDLFVKGPPQIPNHWILVAAIAISIYAFSQWTAQLMFGRLLPTIVAPILSAMSVGYMEFTCNTIGISPWLSLASLLLPFLATYQGTRYWMDGRMGTRFWCGHAIYFSLYVGLPWVPLGVCTLGQPTMPPQLRLTLVDEGIVANREWNPKPFVLGSALKHEHLLDSQNPNHVLPYLYSSVIMARFDLETSTRDKNDATVSSERYRVSMTLLARSAGLLRTSLTIIGQDQADVAEIVLLQELQRPAAREWLGVETFDAIATMLSDSEARDAARRRAIADSWSKYRQQLQRNMESDSFGGYAFHPGRVPRRSMIERTRANRRLEQAVVDFWHIATMPNDSPSLEDFRQIAETWGNPLELYGDGPLGTLHRANNMANLIRSWPANQFSQPAAHWRADWERKARELTLNTPVGPNE